MIPHPRTILETLKEIKAQDTLRDDHDIICPVCVTATACTDPRCDMRYAHYSEVMCQACWEKEQES